MPSSKEYLAWRDMKRRCDPTNQSARNRWHRNKGIKVCSEWAENFNQFLADVGKAPTPKHSLDRINNDGNYEPGNVRWATAKEQANNRTGIRLHMLTFNGITMNISDWSKHLGFPSHTTLNSRITRYGWSVERALSTPALYSRHSHKKSNDSL